ncbi:MAG: hypothetical protein UHP27_03205 [Muribaculaceae bacterium]|nr:hypothetical protein [Muribaculaceae bacterium]
MDSNSTKIVHSGMSEAEVRRLLSAWYEGSDNFASEQRLAEWFASKDDSELPEDLLADAAIFRAMVPVEPCDSTKEAEFEAVLRRVSKPRFTIRRWVRVSVAAAAVAAIVSLVFVGVRQSSIRPSAPAAESASLTASIPDTAETVTVEKIISTAVPDMSMAKAEKRVSRKSAPEADTVTVEQAAEVLGAVMAKLSETLAATNTAIDESAKTMNYSSEKINNALN